jgi:hypothetical protein
VSTAGGQLTCSERGEGGVTAEGGGGGGRGALKCRNVFFCPLSRKMPKVMALNHICIAKYVSHGCTRQQ